ncbi:aldo/keto reductase [Aquimarina sp. U1-2]|uniref:aldo/keto reductase n=1 Tax=Aquimarina sp. U1-2 TaxID=2823141 RepID=UPI001AEC8963|nr:aldo/keto reductase [Aquimarina sp. U1-2]MBP2832113.1 aldo/keto reductase [Aquimarina sp. U1-2]
MSKSSPVFSEIVAGCMNWGSWGANLSVNQTQQLINECVDNEITTFDHADIYGHYTTEALFGKAMKGMNSLREKIQIVTKCGIKLVTSNRPENLIKSYDTSTRYIIRSVENSLLHLNTDYIDLLLIHRPSPLLNPIEIADAFSRLQQDGKVLNFGVSNFTPSQFTLLNSCIPLTTNQIEISALHLEPYIDGTLDQCMQFGIKPMGYSTLGGGKFFTKHPEQRVARVLTIVNQLAKKYDLSVDQILLAWIVKHPSGIIPVVGSTQINRIKAAKEAITLEITDEEWFMVWEASTGEEVA